MVSEVGGWVEGGGWVMSERGMAQAVIDASDAISGLRKGYK